MVPPASSGAGTSTAREAESQLAASYVTSISSRASVAALPSAGEALANPGFGSRLADVDRPPGVSSGTDAPPALSTELCAAVDSLCDALGVPDAPQLTDAGDTEGGHNPSRNAETVARSAKQLGLSPDDVRVLLRMKAAVLLTKIKLLPTYRREQALESESRRGSISTGRAVVEMLDDFPPGVATGDARLNALASVLRMLQVARLRDAQDRVNGILEAAQEFTANPKIESRLGKVGR